MILDILNCGLQLSAFQITATETKIPPFSKLNQDVLGFSQIHKVIDFSLLIL